MTRVSNAAHNGEATTIAKAACGALDLKRLAAPKSMLRN